MNFAARFLRRILGSLTTAILTFKARMAINPSCDPNKEYEVELWLKILGQSYDFQSNYKKTYYEHLETDEEKHKVRATLAVMLKSNIYSVSHKTLIAYVCADIGVTDSLEQISRLRMEPTCSDAEKLAFILACEKFSQPQ